MVVVLGRGMLRVVGGGLEFFFKKKKILLPYFSQEVGPRGRKFWDYVFFFFFLLDLMERLVFAWSAWCRICVRCGISKIVFEAVIWGRCGSGLGSAVCSSEMGQVCRRTPPPHLLVVVALRRPRGGEWHSSQNGLISSFLLLRWTCSVEIMGNMERGRKWGGRVQGGQGREVCMYHEQKGHVVRSRT